MSIPPIETNITQTPFTKIAQGSVNIDVQQVAAEGIASLQANVAEAELNNRPLSNLRFCRFFGSFEPIFDFKERG